MLLAHTSWRSYRFSCLYVADFLLVFMRTLRICARSLSQAFLFTHLCWHLDFNHSQIFLPIMSGSRIDYHLRLHRFTDSCVSSVISCFSYHGLYAGVTVKRINATLTGHYNYYGMAGNVIPIPRSNRTNNLWHIQI